MQRAPTPNKASNLERELTWNIFLFLQLSNEDSGHFAEMPNPLTPPMVRGATDEVKQELQKAIRCRRVAQGLDEMPTLEAKGPNNQVRKILRFSSKILVITIFFIFLFFLVEN